MKRQWHCVMCMLAGGAVLVQWGVADSIRPVTNHDSVASVEGSDQVAKEDSVTTSSPLSDSQRSTMTGEDCDKFVAKKIVYDPPVPMPHLDFWPYEGVIMDFEIYDDPGRPEEQATMHMPGAELATVCGVEVYLNTTLEATMEHIFEFGHIPLPGEEPSEIVLLSEDNWDAGGYEVLFTDLAAQSISEIPPEYTEATIVGSYRPHCDVQPGGICHTMSDLYDFGGAVPSPHAAGVWRLHAFDLYPGASSGTVNEWQVILYAGDGVDDDVDNCPDTYNPDQADVDVDGIGGVCDNCPDHYNPTQADSDGDGIGDACDFPDTDGDGFRDNVDNCPTIYNANQLDVDGDLVGDVCDNCPMLANVDQLDADSDLYGDACDNCPADANVDQLDSDGDRSGDACDNCLAYANIGQDDCDGDGVGDVCTIRDCDGSAECTDCNGNHVPDGCDIQEASPYGGAPATSTDNNSNGIPDECEGSLMKFKKPQR